MLWQHWRREVCVSLAAEFINIGNIIKPMIDICYAFTFPPGNLSTYCASLEGSNGVTVNNENICHTILITKLKSGKVPKENFPLRMCVCVQSLQSIFFSIRL